eukprot:1510937-Prymnesium_polylepis.1
MAASVKPPWSQGCAGSDEAWPSALTGTSTAAAAASASARTERRGVVIYRVWRGCSWRHDPFLFIQAYFLKKPSDFGQGL